MISLSLDDILTFLTILVVIGSALFWRGRKINSYAQFVIYYRDTDTIVDMPHSHQMRITKRSIVLDMQNSVHFSPIHLRCWRKEDSEIITLNLTQQDLRVSDSGETCIDIHYLLWRHITSNEEPDATERERATFMDSTEIIFEFAYYSHNTPLRRIEYFKKEGENYTEQRLDIFCIDKKWAHIVLKGCWFLRHKKIIKKWQEEVKEKKKIVWCDSYGK